MVLQNFRKSIMLYNKYFNDSVIFINISSVLNNKQSFKVMSGNILPQLTIFVLDLIKYNL